MDLELQNVNKSKSYQLDKTDYLIFEQKLKNPTNSAHSISVDLGLISQDVRKRILKMKKSYFLRNDLEFKDEQLGQVKLTETSAVYDPSKIDMSRISILIENVKSKKSIRMLELMSEIHPYTHYRSILISSKLNYLIQFDVPNEVVPKFPKFIVEFLRMCELEDFHIFKFDKLINSNLNLYQLEVLQNKKRSYFAELRPNEVFSQLSESDLNFNYHILNEKINYLETDSNQGNKLKRLEANLLRELTVSSDLVINDLAEKYDKSRVTISKYMNNLQAKIISRYTLHYDPTVFGLDSNVILTGEFKKDDSMNIKSLNSFVKSKYIAFESTLLLNEKRYFWSLNLSNDIISDLMYFLIKHSNNFNSLKILRNSSKNYFFNATMITDNGEINSNKKYYLNEPLSKFQHIWDQHDLK